MKLDTQGGLSPGELDELARLESELCGLCLSWIGLVSRLTRTRSDPWYRTAWSASFTTASGPL